MNNRVQQVMPELRSGLEGLYGGRLKGVYLFGSYARNEEDQESDIDILIILDHLKRYSEELERSSELVSRLFLKYGRSISRVIISERDWSSRTTSFLANAREEAVPV